MSAYDDGERLCTQRQLDEMCRTGVELVQEAIDSGQVDTAAQVAEKVQTARVGLLELFANWAAASLAWTLSEHGEPAMATVLEPERWLALGISTGADLEDVRLTQELIDAPARAGERIAALMERGDPAAARAHWDKVEAATLKLHDFRIDWATQLLSTVYRTYGPSGLQGALDHAAAQPWWYERMTADLQLDPVERITQWSFFLGVGNFGVISVTESDEYFAIHHQVCGSCGRQELRGRHDPPWSLARVAEPVPTLNFGISGYTVYRTHLAAWHFLMPTSRGMAPWPAIDCSGVPGRCWFTIYKNPSRTPARYYESIGATAPAVS